MRRALRGVCSVRGVSLIELLMALVVGAIAFFALAMPLVAERSFSASGRRQAEAQRDAQMALRALARVARQSTSYDIGSGGARITFNAPASVSPSQTTFCGGPSFGNQLRRYTGAACSGTASLLIDGNRSRLTSFAMSSIAENLVRAQLTAAYVTCQNQRNEVLASNLFLRNGPLQVASSGGGGDDDDDDEDEGDGDNNNEGGGGDNEGGND